MFNEAARKELEEIRLKYPTCKGSAPAGPLCGPEGVRLVCLRTHMRRCRTCSAVPKAIARGVGTFYAMYKHKPAGRNSRATLHECLMHDPGRRKTCGFPEGQIRA